jgi:hypothetical protein
MEITIKELFQQFTSQFGHKVIAKRQQEWENSPEHWEHHALNHIAYWTLVDLKKFTHIQACKELEKKNHAELLKETLNIFFTVGKYVSKPSPIKADDSLDIKKKEILKHYHEGVRDFSRMNLEGISLSGVNLSSANLSGTNFKNADLSDADLSDANLTGANLTGANLRGTDLRGAQLDKLLVRPIMTLSQEDMDSVLEYQIWDNIKSSGIHINIFEDEDNGITCYSVGASALGLPELLINGFHPEQACLVINYIFNQMKEGNKSNFCEAFQLFEGKSLVKLKPLTRENIIDVTTFSDWFAKRSLELLVFQIIISDKKSLFPGEPEFDTNYSQHLYCKN